MKQFKARKELPKEFNGTKTTYLKNGCETSSREFGKDLTNDTKDENLKKIYSKKHIPILNPKNNEKSIKNKQPIIENNEIEIYDESVKNNPQYVVEYIYDIIKYMKETETINFSKIDYLKNQAEINQKMRAILVDWLIEVHLKFQLLPETLFLTINIIDRFLTVEKIQREKFQLLGVASMLIASKYEEIYPPEIRDFVYITEKTYTKEEIIKMEFNILVKLNFDMLTVSPYRFLERYNFICGDNQQVFFIAQFLIELLLLEVHLNIQLNSFKAATSIYFARKILQISPSWPNELEVCTGFTENGFKNYVKEICNLIEYSNRTTLKALYTKFSSKKFLEVFSILRRFIEN